MISDRTRKRVLIIELYTSGHRTNLRASGAQLCVGRAGTEA